MEDIFITGKIKLCSVSLSVFPPCLCVTTFEKLLVCPVSHPHTSYYYPRGMVLGAGVNILQIAGTNVPEEFIKIGIFW